jgi:hypothetical protein
MELSLGLEVHSQASLFTDAHTGWIERTYNGSRTQGRNVSDHRLLKCRIFPESQFFSIQICLIFKQSRQWILSEKFE